MAFSKELQNDTRLLTNSMGLLVDSILYSAKDLRGNINKSTSVIKRTLINASSVLSSAPGFVVAGKSLNYEQIENAEALIKNLKSDLDALEKKLESLKNIYQIK